MGPTNIGGVAGGALGFMVGGPAGAALGMQVGSQVGGAIEGSQTGKAEEAVMKRNIAIKEQESKQIENVTGLKQQKQAEESARLQSSMEAGLAAGGAVSTTGTGLLAQARQAAESELQNLYIGYEGATQAGKVRSEAEMMKYEKKLHAQKRKSELFGGLLQAGGTALEGFPKYGGVGTPTAGKGTTALGDVRGIGGGAKVSGGGIF